MSSNFSRYSRLLGTLSGPIAFVDLELFDRNAASLVTRAGGLPIRVASKSVRCVSLLKRVLESPGFSGVLAYSGFEAAHLADSGIDDIVIGYPVVDAAELGAVVRRLKEKKRITLMVDHPDHLRLLAAVSESAGIDLPIALDVDLSSRWPGLHFGVHRSWLSTEPRLREFLAELRKYPRLRIDGLMGYEAQIAGVADSPLTRVLKKISRPHAHRFRALAVRLVREAGHPLRFVNGGGTGSLESTRGDPSVTELAAGSGLYAPTLFDHYDSFSPSPAAGFALRVTRKPEAEWAVCQSGGYIASGAAGASKLPSPYLPEGLELSPLEGAGEVQTPVTGESARTLRIGDLVFFRHAKAGELCERFSELHFISGETRLAPVPTYRGEGKSFG